jgi:plastocyanin
MRKLWLIPLLAIANLGQAPAVKGGTVTGSVVAVSKGKPIKTTDVWVYLEGTTPPKSSLGDGVVAQIVQKKLEFEPKIVVIPKGAKVFFPNRDPDEHNVFSPEVRKNAYFGFDLGRYGTDKIGRHRKFFELCEFDIYCDIHMGMWAKVKVIPTRYFTRVVDGKFTLTDVAPGTYTLVAWAPDSLESRSSQAFEVKAGETKTAESLNVQYVAGARGHRRVDGSEYDPYPQR